MYIPSFNKFTDNEEIISFIKKYSFAIIITVKDGIPSATHLPFLVKEVDGQLILSSHFAKANPQAFDINNNSALIIFSEPHAYISPKNYEKETNVPTWNYLAVHAYGKCSLLDGNENKLALLKETVTCYEADYQKQWENLPDNYRQNMMNGIVAFEVIVDDLQAKKKLSQNKTDSERENIIKDLNNSQNDTEKDIAAYMEALRNPVK